MAVITQNYDIDLKATGEFPVVKMSQFDTGSRTIVFTVYDGHELAKIDGCLARVDGTRSDGVEFSRSCTVSAGSKVSFTISQEMTKHAGKHAAELVIFDANGNPIGTQNFVIEVEAATMVRDSAASADDRTLYDQYTDSIEQKFSDLSNTLNNKANALNKTVEDISGLVGASSKPITVFDDNVMVNGNYSVNVRLTYDPITALVHAYAYGEVAVNTGNAQQFDLHTIDAKYCPDEKYFNNPIGNKNPAYVISSDNLKELISGDTAKNTNFIGYYIENESNVYKLKFWLAAGAPDHDGVYEIAVNTTWYARGGKYIGVSQIGTGGNTVTVGTTTTGDPGTQASVVNSGTAKDVVLDFTIPRGAGGATSTIKVGTVTTGDAGSSASVTNSGTDTAVVLDFTIPKGDKGDAGSGGGATNVNADGVQVIIGSGATNYAGSNQASATAVGANAKAGFNDVALGSGANAAANGNCTAIGANASSLGTNSVAIGVSASVDSASYSSVAIGQSATVTYNNSVAIGAGSKATEQNTFAVGDPNGTKRRIVGVAEPTATTDAVTKAYVDALIAKLKSDNNLN